MAVVQLDFLQLSLADNLAAGTDQIIPLNDYTALNNAMDIGDTAYLVIDRNDAVNREILEVTKISTDNYQTTQRKLGTPATSQDEHEIGDEVTLDTVSQYYTELQKSAPIGSVIAYAGATPPNGWLFCNGSSKLVSAYSGLHSVIGYTYGGSGLNFTLPNLKGNVVVGLNASDSSFDSLGETGGAKTHTLSTAELASHTHIQDAHTHIQVGHGHTAWTDTPGNHAHTVDAHDFLRDATSPQGNRRSITSGGNSPYATSGSGDHGHAVGVSNTQATNSNATATNQTAGSGTAHNNLQPYIVLNYIIKY